MGARGYINCVPRQSDIHIPGEDLCVMYHVSLPLDQMENTVPRPVEDGGMRKKRHHEWRDVAATSNVDVRRMRILGRRYNLTRTGYKYLEIGIGIPSSADAVTVHIALGDTTGKEILLTTAMWKALVDSRALICDNLARANSEHGSHPPMQLGDLAVRFAAINSQPTIRLDTPSGRMILSAPTVRFLYGLQHCVHCVLTAMTSVVGRAEAKLRAFRHIAAGVQDPSMALRAISSSAEFDRDDLLDCEMLPVVVGDI